MRVLWGRGERAGLLLLAALNFAAVLWFFQAALTSIPNTGDEHALVFQARVFSSGRLSAPAPAQPQYFMTHYIGQREGRWFGTYPAVYPLVLAIGLKLGGMKALIALLSSLTLLLVFRLVRDAYQDRPLAWLTVLLLAAAPSFRFYSASYYSHVGSLLLSVFCVDLALRCGRGAGWTRAVLGLGLAGVVGMGVRPFEMFWVLLPSAAFVLAARSRGRAWGGREWAAVAAAVLAVAVAVLVFNRMLSGNDYLRMVNSGGRLAIGRNLDWRGLARLWSMLADTAKWLFGLGFFPSGNLKIAAPGEINASIWLLCAGTLFAAWEARRDGRWRRPQALLLSVAFCAVAGHLFYDKQGGRFGERRFFEVSFIFCLFAARLLLAMARRVPRKVSCAVFPVLLGSTVVCCLPGTIAYIRDDNELRFDLYLQAQRQGIQDAVIFVRDVPWLTPFFYARNDPDLKGNVYVIDHGRSAPAARLFPGRKTYAYFFDWKVPGYVLRQVPARAGPRLARPVK